MASRSLSTRPGGLPLRGLTFLATSVALAACGGRDGTWAPDRFLDRDGVQVLYRLGGVEGSGPAVGGGAMTAFDSSGRLHVLDGANHRTLVFDRTGNLEWEYGREGRGPGEFSYPTGFGLTAEGAQVVADLANRSLIRISAEGALEGTSRLADEVGFPAGHLIALDGEVLALPDPDVYSTAAPDDTLAWRIRTYDLEEPAARTWLEVWRAPEPEGTGEPLTLGGRTMSVRVAGLTHLRSFWPKPRFARTGESIAVFDSTTYRIRLYDATGDPFGRLERAIAPVAVTGALRDAERSRRLAAIDAGEGPRFQISGSDGSFQGVDQAMVDDFVREQIEIMTFWPEVPALHDMVGNPDGLLWVQRNGRDGRPGLIDVFDTDRGYLGTLPAGSALPVALGPDGLAAYVEVGPLGVIAIRVESWSGPAGSDPEAAS
ncbi:MAG: hypothetical protein HKO53_04930 [Gemmatimonadetes bacterium]|nr:hypothetical protein [Gemmatimonadota bacterium]